MLIYAIIVLVLIALGVWVVDLLAIIPSPINRLIQALIVVIGIIAIAHKAGMF